MKSSFCRLLSAATLAAALLSGPSAASTPLTLHFGGGFGSVPGHGHLDLGRASAPKFRRAAGGSRMQARISLRLESPTPGEGTARVWVALNDAPEGVVLRVDGLPIGPVPTLITPVHRIGVDVGHDIEVSVPAHLPPGPFSGNLSWTAEAN